MSEETKVYPPSEEFAKNAVAGKELYAEAKEDRLAYWARRAREQLRWEKDFTEVLDWSDAPFAKWFADGTTNAAYNALDRHVEAGNGDRVAIHFEGEPGDTRDYTYAELAAEVRKAANAFESLGVAKGDRVAVYLPMIPEAVITMLACARIGAVHSVVFGGFSADALRTRINDADAKVVVTADGQWRRGKPSPLKPAVDEALAEDGQHHRRWMPHGTSHHLGLDVHDCAQAKRELYLDGVLEPGMVFTIEPGLYFKEEDLAVPEEYRGMGIRIEDDVLVTEDGCRNLSAALPRGADEVEAWMGRLRG